MVFGTRPVNQLPYRQHPRYYRNTTEIPNIPQQRNEPTTDITSLTNKGKIGLSKTLNNVQQVLKVVETTAPIIQQYGPLVKNLPMMLSIMKEFNKTDNEGTTQPQREETSEKSNVDQSMPSTVSKKIGSGERKSTPKLFI